MQNRLACQVPGWCEREAARGVAVASREQGYERGASQDRPEQGRAGTRSLQHNVATFLLKFFLARAKDVAGFEQIATNSGTVL